MLRDLDVDRLSREFRSAEPFPHIVIDPLIEPSDAREIAESFPSYEAATQQGRAFTSLNENLKVQVTEYARFPDKVKAMADRLASAEFLKTLETITGISNLVWDDGFAGGGMHQTARSGILDVHVDFNLVTERDLYRRLNLLIYLNPEWDAAWGGLLELWNQDVKVLYRSVVPTLGRAVLFETSEISYHGVTAVNCPPSVARRSFAVYYYTREPPENYSGVPHATIFKPRPYEYKKRFFSMPIAAAEERLNAEVGKVKGKIKSILGR